MNIRNRARILFVHCPVSSSGMMHVSQVKACKSAHVLLTSEKTSDATAETPRRYVIVIGFGANSIASAIRRCVFCPHVQQQRTIDMPLSCNEYRQASSGAVPAFWKGGCGPLFWTNCDILFSECIMVYRYYGVYGARARVCVCVCVCASTLLSDNDICFSIFTVMKLLYFTCGRA
jgi:hypothetical protein